MTQNIKHEIFTVLKNIPARSKQDEAMYNGGKKMPPIMVDWMTGRPTQEILEETKKYIKSSNYSSGEKALFLKIADMIFQPDKLIQVLDPIKPMVQLAKSMKNKGYKLYVLSNWDHESFPLMLKKHAEIFNLFDGILISGTQGMGKPNPKFYKKLMKTYKLRPKETIFIDDEPYNIQAAEKLGIHGVLKDSYQSVINQMTELEIIKIEKS